MGSRCSIRLHRRIRLEYFLRRSVESGIFFWNFSPPSITISVNGNTGFATRLCQTVYFAHKKLFGFLICLFLRSQRACPFRFTRWTSPPPSVDVLRSERFKPILDRSGCTKRIRTIARAANFTWLFSSSVCCSPASAKLVSFSDYLHVRLSHLHAKRKSFFEKNIYFMCTTVICRKGRGKSISLPKGLEWKHF